MSDITPILDEIDTLDTRSIELWEYVRKHHQDREQAQPQQVALVARKAAELMRSQYGVYQQLVSMGDTPVVVVPDPIPTPTLPPVVSDLETIIVPGDKLYRDNFFRDFDEHFRLAGRRYLGQDCHGFTNGTALRIVTKKGGTVTLEDLEIHDTSAGIILQGDRNEPIEEATLRRIRITDTWRNGINRTNYNQTRPQPLYTANVRKINIEDSEIVGSRPPGVTEVQALIHNIYAGTGDGRLNEVEINLKNVVLGGAGYGGINASQLHNVENVVIFDGGVNWNVDGELDRKWGFPRITGTMKNCFSIAPHKLIIFGDAPARPWGQHTHDRATLPGLTEIDGNPLDMAKLMATPRGSMATEAIRQLRVLGLAS